jgi:hypothetical protein
MATKMSRMKNVTWMRTSVPAMVAILRDHFMAGHSAVTQRKQTARADGWSIE